MVMYMTNFRDVQLFMNICPLDKQIDFNALKAIKFIKFVQCLGLYLQT